MINDPLELFTLWAAAALDFPVKSEGDGVYRLEIPEGRQLFEGSREVRFSCGTSGANGAIQSVAADSPLFEWLIEQLQARQLPLHAAPWEQPVSVAELSPALFEAYEIDGGKVHLAGCTLEDDPLVRLSFRLVSADRSAELVHVFVHGNDVLSEEPLRQLGAERLKPLTNAPRNSRLSPPSDWLQRAEVLARESVAASAESLVCRTLVWCKYSSGKLTFEFDGASIEIPFRGWAKRLAEGTERPPPYSCPLTGTNSYHLAATDDGRITAASQIAVCCESNRRVLTQELQVCEDSGQRALPDFMVTCPVSGRRVLRSLLATCSTCRQAVSTSVIKSGRCAACRDLQPIDKSQPRLARVLGEYPKLDRWRKWKIAETTEVYIFSTTSILRRLIVVLDKDSLEPRQLLTGNRLLPNLTPVPESLWDDSLGHN